MLSVLKLFFLAGKMAKGGSMESERHPE